MHKDLLTAILVKLEWVNAHSFCYKVAKMISKHDIEQLIKPHLQKDHIHLCGTRVSGRAGKPLIQLFVDWEENYISVAECAAVSRQVQDLLDMQEWIPGDYQLVVSSPGIDWPMSELWQFRKNIGRKIRNSGPERILEGKLVNVLDDGRIYLEIGEDTNEYTTTELSGAKVVIEIFDRSGAKRKRNETRSR